MRVGVRVNVRERVRSQERGFQEFELGLITNTNPNETCRQCCGQKFTRTLRARQNRQVESL